MRPLSRLDCTFTVKDSKLGLLNERSTRIRDGYIGVIAIKEFAATSTLELIQSAAESRLGQFEPLRRPREAEVFCEKYCRFQVPNFRGCFHCRARCQTLRETIGIRGTGGQSPMVFEPLYVAGGLKSRVEVLFFCHLFAGAGVAQW